MSWVIVNYSTIENNETFYVSEAEEKSRRTHRVRRFLKAVVPVFSVIFAISKHL